MSTTLPTAATARRFRPVFGRPFIIVVDVLMMLAGLVFSNVFLFVMGAAFLALSLLGHVLSQSNKRAANEVTLSKMSLTDLLAMLGSSDKQGISSTEIFATLNRQHADWRHQAEPRWTTPVIIADDPRHPIIEPPTFSSPVPAVSNPVPGAESAVSVVESVPDIIFETQTVQAEAVDSQGPSSLLPEDLVFDSIPQIEAPQSEASGDAVAAAAPPLEVVDKTGGQMDEATLRQYLLTGGDFLTAAQIGALAGWNDKRPGTRLNKWKRAGVIFCVRHKNQDLFPVYALDPANGYQPRPEVACILKTFEDKKGPWGVAFWFASVNSVLGGARPQDELVVRADQVLSSASDEIAGIQHG